jgi:peroxiredoxin Q/BCP
MSNSIALNKVVPEFTLAATGGKQVSIPCKHNIVLYFYPKDSTPGCTIQGQNFRDQQEQFSKCNTVIYGISRDSLKSHEKFKEKQEFNFDLLVDDNEQACQIFDVMKQKNMYGKQVRGIERSTFIIDSQGILRHQWRKVKVESHVEEVLSICQELFG